MNTTRTTPPPSTPKHSLTAHEPALEAAGTAAALALGLPVPLRTLADQLVRSASSVPGSLAEGAGRQGRDRLHHWRIAYASALEADSHPRLLRGTGAVNGPAARRALELFDRVRALTWRLIHPRR
ncbi:MAG: four helix bundle protein [Acidobacteriota bacterium]|jgi:four helix bundle protein